MKSDGSNHFCCIQRKRHPFFHFHKYIARNVRAETHLFLALF